MAGAVVPIPTPDNASAPAINRSVLSAPTIARPSIDSTIRVEPNTALRRSPTRVAT